MKTVKILALLLVITQSLAAQTMPCEFNLTEKNLGKIQADTPLGNSIGKIIVVGDTVIVSTGPGLSRTTDSGESWTNMLDLTLQDNNGLVTAAYSNGVIWASFVTQVEKLGEMQTAGNGLGYSADNGNTWHYIPQPIDQLTDTLVVYGKNILPAVPVHTTVSNITYDIALINKAIWIASWAGGLRKSTDMGKTWQKIVLPPDHLDKIAPEDILSFSVSSRNLNHSAFSIAVVDSLTFYVGTAGGVNKTTDGGVSWRKFNHLNQLKPISGNFVNYIFYNPLSKTLYASTWRAEGSTESYALSFTTDGGESWTVALDGEKPRGFGSKGEEIIVATENGVFRSSNMGKTWILPGKITDKKSGLSITTKIFNSAASQGDDIWLGSDFGLVKLTERGSMWNGDWRIFLASQPVGSRSDSYAFPNPFSPDVEKVNIKYTTGGHRASVTIRVFDFGMNLVRTVIQNAERSSPAGIGNSQDGGIIDFWDGRNEKGDIVPNGVYFYRIDFDNGELSFGKIIVLM